MKTVGIIGGLGPETTAEFYLDIVFSCQNRDRTHRPSILISNVPVPYQIEEDAVSKNIGIEGFAPFLVKEAQRLEKSGADFLVMPCNSLHVFIQLIRESVHIPVLSIVEETTDFLKQNAFHRVGIVSTSATIQNRLYEIAFEKEDIAYITPEPLQQAKLGKLIHHLIIGQQSNREREELIGVINDFESKEVDCVVLACTDLQLLIPTHPRLKIFDTMKIFVDATVEYILNTT